MSIEVSYNDIPFEVSRDNEDLIEELKEDISEFGEEFKAYGITRIVSVKVPFTKDKYIFVEVFEDYQLAKEDVELFDDEKSYCDTLKNLLERAEKENSIN